MAIEEVGIPGLQSVGTSAAPPPDPTTFHGRLELFRRYMGLSKSQMARDLNVAIPTLHTWLKGTVPTCPTQLDLVKHIQRTYSADDSFRNWLAWGDDSLSPTYAGIEWDLRAQRIEVREAWGRREHDLAS